MNAWNLTRRETHYRHDAFSAGLRAAGYDVRSGAVEAKPGNVMLIWNRYGAHDQMATAFERGGGTVLVAENGYLAPGGLSPHSMPTRDPYALARGYHNDSTVIPEGGPERWDALGVALAPWRADGGHVLVAPNRAFGAPGRAMPPDWANDVCRRLAKLTKREIRIRPHPGNDAPRKPLAEDLAGAWACVIWSSSAGVHALVAGVPVICEAPFWIAKGAAYSSWADAEMQAWDEMNCDDDRSDKRRLTALHRLARAQFSLQEIQSGFAFTSLLQPAAARKAEVSPCP